MAVAADSSPRASRVLLGVALLVAGVAALVLLSRPANRSGRPATSDPDFAAFLDEVKKLTPPDAAITLVVPSNPERHLAEAAVRLAPRHVFLGRETEASFVAAYRYQYRGLKNPDVIPVPNGALFRRQVISTK